MGSSDLLLSGRSKPQCCVHQAESRGVEPGTGRDALACAYLREQETWAWAAWVTEGQGVTGDISARNTLDKTWDSESG